MKRKIVYVAFLISIVCCEVSTAQSDSIRLTIPIVSGELWWVGIINHGSLMPIKNGYHANLYANLYGNQAQPLLLSNKGNLVWSDEPFSVQYRDQSIYLSKALGTFQSSNAGKNLREAYLYASKTFFPASGKTPDKFLFTNPQYNTWIELLYNQNQTDVLKYAKSIIDNGFPPGVIMIDDNWQQDYGTWTFHPGRFPDPKTMIATLHSWGFKVMVWVCPFVSPDSEIFRKLQQSKVLLCEKDGYPVMVKWWNGSSAVLDFSDPGAVTWFNEQLKVLVNTYHVDGFKFDAGDPEFYVNGYSDKSISPNEHAELFSKIGEGYSFNEYRATWKSGGQPLAQRLRDKGHNWNDLKVLMPNILLQGIMGYPFTCPDMIGGGEMGSFLELKKINQDLVVRSAQCHALMPMMQFSVAPWRILDSVHLAAVKKSVSLRSAHTAEILSLAEHAAKTGEPIVRMMAYEFPRQGLDNVTDQFMLGKEILVAPILTNDNSRTVLLPKGKWQDMISKKIITGPTSIKVTARLDELPYFLKK